MYQIWYSGLYRPNRPNHLVVLTKFKSYSNIFIVISFICNIKIYWNSPFKVVNWLFQFWKVKIFQVICVNRAAWPSRLRHSVQTLANLCTLMFPSKWKPSVLTPCRRPVVSALYSSQQTYREVRPVYLTLSVREIPW